MVAWGYGGVARRGDGGGMVAGIVLAWHGRRGRGQLQCSGTWLLWCSKRRGAVVSALEEEGGVRWWWGMEGEEWQLRVLIRVSG